MLLAAIRAVSRGDGRWCLLAGAVAGAGLENKLLVAYLLLGIAVGLIAVGPRVSQRSGWLWAGGRVRRGAACAAAARLPGVERTPQLRIGAALAADHGCGLVDLPYLALLLRPIAVPVWIAECASLFLRGGPKVARFVPIAFGVVVVCAVLGVEPSAAADRGHRVRCEHDGDQSDRTAARAGIRAGQRTAAGYQ